MVTKAERKLVVVTMRKHLNIAKEILVEGKIYKLFDMWESRKGFLRAKEKAQKDGWLVRMKVRSSYGEPIVWILYRRRG